MLETSRKTRLVLVGILSASLFLLLISCLYFLYVSIVYKTSYPNGLTHHYRQFEKGRDQAVDPFSLVDPKEDKVLIYSLYADGKTAALYDPENYYFSELESTNTGGRYFSSSDYQQGIKGSLPVTDGHDDDEYSLIQESYGFYYVNPQVSFYYPGLERVDNLMGKDQLGKIVFIDGKEEKTLDKISQKLAQLGYQLEKKVEMDFPSILRQIGEGVPFAFIFYFSLLPLGLSILAILALYYFVQEDQRYLSLLFLSGLERKEILRQVLRKVGVAILVGALSSALLLFLMMEFLFQLTPPHSLPTFFLPFYLLHTLFLFLLSWLFYALALRKINRSEGGSLR